MRLRKFWIGLLGLFFCLFFLAAEMILRSHGATPWRLETTEFLVEPGGSLFCKSPLLGYANRPGRFDVLYGKEHRFSATHLSDGTRATRSVGADGSLSPFRKEIWVLGCSFSYGWLLSDPESFPWILQERFQGCEIVNFATAGYGALQSLLQLKEALRTRGRPEVVVLAYASFQDDRNTAQRSIRKAFRLPGGELGNISLPYARVGFDGEMRYGMVTARYREFPFAKYFAICNLIDNKINAIEGAFLKSHDISKYLINEIWGLCKKNDVRFVVMGIDNDPLTEEMLSYCQKRGMLVVDAAVDMSLEEHRVLLHDSHPSGSANEKYAARLGSFLKANELV